MWGCFWDGGFVVDFLNFFLKFVIFDLMFGEVFKFLVLFFISFSNICVFLSLFVFVVFFLFGGGYWFELLVIFVGGFMLLNCCLVGSVWVWLFEWVFLIFGVIGMEWYIVGLVFFLFIEEEDDECMVFMMIDVLYFMLDVLDIFFFGVVLLDEEKMEEFVFFLLWWDVIVGLVCYDCFDVLFLVGLLFMWFVG